MPENPNQIDEFLQAKFHFEESLNTLLYDSRAILPDPILPCSIIFMEKSQVMLLADSETVTIKREQRRTKALNKTNYYFLDDNFLYEAFHTLFKL